MQILDSDSSQTSFRLLAVPARTRLKFSAAMVAMATIGIFASNYLEERLPVPPKSNQKST